MLIQFLKTSLTDVQSTLMYSRFRHATHAFQVALEFSLYIAFVFFLAFVLFRFECAFLIQGCIYVLMFCFRYLRAIIKSSL